MSFTCHPSVGFLCKDRDRVVYLLRWLASTCNVPFHGALGEPEDPRTVRLWWMGGGGAGNPKVEP